METTKKNVFISHYGGDDKHVQGLKGLLSTKGYQLRNSSIDSTKTNDAKNDHYIKYNLLKPGIQWASTCIVLIGPETHKRHWVNWEIEQAFKLGKKILGVFINGAKDSDIPENLKLYTDNLVGWSGDNIISCIEDNEVAPENSDGTPYINPYRTERSEC